MSKNISKNITIRQYKLTDISLFTLLLFLAELLPFLAIKKFGAGAYFTLSFMLPISLLVMMRWGWEGTLFAMASGLFYCLFNKGGAANYLTYCLGNAFIALTLIPMKFITKQRITKTWYWTVVYILLAGSFVYLGRSIVIAFLSVVGMIDAEWWIGFASFVNGTSILSLVIAMVILIPLRKFDGMVEDQKTYLKRLDAERRKKMQMDDYGYEEVELDEQTLKMFKKNDDMFS